MNTQAKKELSVKSLFVSIGTHERVGAKGSFKALGCRHLRKKQI